MQDTVVGIPTGSRAICLFYFLLCYIVHPQLNPSLSFAGILTFCRGCLVPSYFCLQDSTATTKDIVTILSKSYTKV